MRWRTVFYHFANALSVSEFCPAGGVPWERAGVHTRQHWPAGFQPGEHEFAEGDSGTGFSSSEFSASSVQPACGSLMAWVPDWIGVSTFFQSRVPVTPGGRVMRVS